MAKVSEVTPYLYHYTNEQGLYGILKVKEGKLNIEEQCLWATHYKFLNDASEIELFRKHSIELLYPYTFDAFKKLIPKYKDLQESILNETTLNILVNGEINRFVDAGYEVMNPEIYITSFTGNHTNSSPATNDFINENGLLSQWRGYGIDGGFAIVFKTQELEAMLSAERDSFHYDNPILLADVVYSDDVEKRELELSESLRKISAYLTEMLEQELQGKREQPDNMGEVYDSFVSCMTRYKHEGFSEEQEFRIISMPAVLNKVYQETTDEKYCNSKLEKKREFRTSNGKQIPYIELFYSLKTPLPIEKIIVGPHKDKDSRAAMLRIMLRNTDIEVTVSEIPYQ